MANSPIVLVHGYSDRGESFFKWREALEADGFDVKTINVCTYKTLTNEISIKDIAEGFNSALRQVGLGNGEPFDAIVHSTGMLVVRAWLTNYAGRQHRVKRLIGLAPATFGSPLAKKGRSWMGAVFKGNRELGPDFMEAGDMILDGLELASRFTWDLAHQDLIGDRGFYGPDRETPYVFTLVGNQAYGGLRSFVNAPGSDGTVRWAGCALNTRKIVLDLTIDGSLGERATVCASGNAETDLVMIDGVNHSTILSNPQPSIELVKAALSVDSIESYREWNRKARQTSDQAEAKVNQWQQFIVRAVDERGDPIPDYNLQLYTGDGDRLHHFDIDVVPYSNDSSFRCFHVNLSNLEPEKITSLSVHLIANSGSNLVDYYGIGSETRDGNSRPLSKWDAVLDITKILKGDFKLFWPYTTTMIELKLNREPNPPDGVPELCKFLV